jgi:hypothetical protein
MTTNVKRRARKPVQSSDLLWPWVDVLTLEKQVGQSRSSIRRWRLGGMLTQGIHWQWTPTTGKNPKTLFNRDLIRDWLGNGGDQNNPSHQRAIEAYLASLPSSAT